MALAGKPKSSDQCLALALQDLHEIARSAGTALRSAAELLTIVARETGFDRSPEFHAALATLKLQADAITNLAARGLAEKMTMLREGPSQPAAVSGTAAAVGSAAGQAAGEVARGFGHLRHNVVSGGL